ncbi:MAG: peroxiredoxin [Nitriliruptoraceae bacterium]
MADLTVRLDTGEPTTLSQLANGQRLVVFFYPKAFSGGCTAHACNFRNLSAEFEAAGAVRVGVSCDKIDTQAKFAAKNNFDFPLIADTDGTVAKAFGTKRIWSIRYARHIFVLDAQLTVTHVLRDEIRMRRHANDALAALSGS